MELNAQAALFFVLPVLVIVAWPLLWWRGRRRTRLWCAGLTPIGAVAGAFLGVLVSWWEKRLAGPVSCVEGVVVVPCTSGWALFAANNEATLGLGLMIAVNSALAFVVAVVLGGLTVIVELVLLGVRAERGTSRQWSEDPLPSADR